MKIKMVNIIALFAGLLCIGSVQAQTWSPPWKPAMTAYMIVFDAKDGAVIWENANSTLVTGQYTLEELGTYTDDYLTFNFLPETNKFVLNQTYLAVTNFYRNETETDGSKYLDCLTFWERTIIGTESNVVMDFTINSNDLDTNRYEVVAFIKHVIPGTGASLAITNLDLTGVTSGSYSIEIAANYGVWAGDYIQAGFRISGTNASPAVAATLGSVNVTVDDLYLLAPDFESPDPNPLTWDLEPTALSDDKIEMRATTATDPSGVEYRFFGYIAFPAPPVFDSGWQSDPYFLKGGLTAATTYKIRCKARDLAEVPNETGYAPLLEATTVATDTAAPTPNPAEIGFIEASSISVYMVANPVTDTSVVEYNFVPTTTNGTASGWQRSNEYIDYNLNPETTYSYTLQVRDLAAAPHTNGVSDVASVNTLSKPFSGSLTNDLKGFAGSSIASVAQELAMAGFELATLDSAKPVYVDATGLTFGNYQGTNGTYNDRNILRTIASDYADADFTVEVTFAYSNQIEQVCFVGGGHGIQGQYNVPDFFLVGTNYPGGGVSGVTAETSAAWVKLFTWLNGTELVPVGDPAADPPTANPLVYATGLVTLTNRVRLTYDAATTNVTYEVDFDADGFGGFAADLTLGPVTLTNVWQTGSPQKLYISGGAGTRMYDLAITSANVPITGVSDLVIASSDGSSAVLQWTGLLGQTYDIVYKTALTDPTWTVDAANENIPGAGGVLTRTNNVAGNEVFFSVTTE